MAKELIVVFGSTGQQGGSVVRFLAATGKFAIRGVTRNATSSKAAELKKLYSGIELVEANLDDMASLEAGMKGAHGVFSVTDFWEHGYDTEVRHGKNLVDAAKAAGIQHFVWSTFDHSDVSHFESKSEVNEYLIQSGVPRTSLYTSFYFQPNQPVSVTKEGNYVIPFGILPDAKLFRFAVEDTGAWVSAAFLDPKNWIGKDMKVVSQWLSTREMASIASKVTGKKIVPVEMSQEQFLEAKNSKDPVAAELFRSKLFAVEHPPESGVRDLDMSLKLFPEVTTYEAYIRENKDFLFVQD